ncbi:MAG: outer membrane protein TolC [Mariniblastus sp.]|jgi:outer membrane protein TolC
MKRILMDELILSIFQHEHVMTGVSNDFSSARQAVSEANAVSKTVGLLCVALAVTWLAGCSQQRKQNLQFTSDCSPCQSMLQQIEYPDLACEEGTDGSELMTAEPTTLSNFHSAIPWELTVEECVELALANSKVMQKLGGVVVNSPGATTTLYDQAITETGGTSVEQALSAFDAQVNTGLFTSRNERKFNNVFFGGGAASSITQAANFNFEISKQTATGASFAMRNTVDYNRSNIPSNLFGSTYDIVNQVEVRQPLARGRGTMINRIAGPNATAGIYNGVMIARIRSDISLATFEASVRNLVRDVETNYWELYYAYRDLDTKVAARTSSRETWRNRKLRFDAGTERPDDEAQARQQYFSFQAQAQNALTGVLNGQPGVLGAERNLRRLMGLPASDGKVVRPISDPSLAPVAFDWSQSQQQALGRRVEIRSQKWSVRQRELELLAAKSLNKWRFDLVGQYGFRGFGDDLFGGRSRPSGSAFDDLINGDLDDWQVGVELGGAIGNRAGHLAIRNAELNLVRERVLLKEQQRQIMHDLNAAFTEVDRAMANLKTSFNSRVATQDELVPKRKRVDGDVDSVFFLLDAEQRAATAESAVHRAVADYNQALLNYSYASGGLLSRYNIRLTEGEWSESAQANAARKAPRFRRTDNGANQVDVQPVSYGQYDQSAAQPMGGANYNNSPLESNLPSEYDTAPVSDNSVGAVINNKAFDHNGAALIAQDYLRR